MKAVIIISHGSRISKTKEEVCSLIERIKELTPISFIECAFLELESPSIPESIDTCVKKGAKEIIILLNFLNAGRHVDADIPQIVNEARARFPHVKFHITPPVGQHSGIAELFAQMLSPYTHS
ncbi:MAG: CbiX/SirB N-terminal domain-containing protein [Candidatus Omnitrophica bacterium]|nr:CbiX/SirB N-terminal domain-containing protein [Candidatus Omnitrophota bacterium]